MIRKLRRVAPELLAGGALVALLLAPSPELRERTMDRSHTWRSTAILHVDTNAARGALYGTSAN